MVACGGENLQPLTAPTPPPAPSALLVAEARSEWVACNWLIPSSMGGPQCALQGELRNRGSGCGVDVRGVTRFYNGQQQVGAAYSWSLPADQIVRPNESVVYQTGLVANFTTTTAYVTEPSWTNVRC